MLFDPRARTEAPEACAPLLFADWEAVSFTPYLWDFTYCTVIGLSVEERRQHQVRIQFSLNELVTILTNGDDIACRTRTC